MMNRKSLTGKITISDEVVAFDARNTIAETIVKQSFANLLCLELCVGMRTANPLAASLTQTQTQGTTKDPVTPPVWAVVHLETLNGQRTIRSLSGSRWTTEIRR